MREESPLSLVLWTADIGAMSSFLEAVTGASVAERHPGFAAIELAGARVLLHDDESYRGHPWYQALGQEGVTRGLGAELRFRVDGVDARFAAALRLGAVAVQPPHELEGAWTCQVMGPDGFLLTLWEPCTAA